MQESSSRHGLSPGNGSTEFNFLEREAGGAEHVILLRLRLE